MSFLFARVIMFLSFFWELYWSFCCLHQYSFLFPFPFKESFSTTKCKIRMFDESILYPLNRIMCRAFPYAITLAHRKVRTVLTNVLQRHQETVFKGKLVFSTPFSFFLSASLNSPIIFSNGDRGIPVNRRNFSSPSSFMLSYFL